MFPPFSRTGESHDKINDLINWGAKFLLSYNPLELREFLDERV